MRNTTTLSELLKNKKWLAVIAAVAVIVLLIVLSLTVWSAPDKEDFRAMEQQISTIKESRKSMDDASGGFVAAVFKDDAEAIKRKKAAYQSARDDVRRQIESLDDMKAAKDDEIDKKIDALEDEFERLENNINGLVDGYPKLTSLYGRDGKCNDTFSIRSSFSDRAPRYKAALADCLPILDNLTKSSNPHFAKFGRVSAQTYREQLKSLETLAESDKFITEITAKLPELMARADKARGEESDRLHREVRQLNDQMHESQEKAKEARSTYIANSKVLTDSYRDVISDQQKASTQLRKIVSEFLSEIQELAAKRAA